MRKLAGIVVFVSLASVAIAERKPTPKPTPKPTEGAARATDTSKSSIRNLRITQIYDLRKIFTATAEDGKAYRFSYPKTEELKLGSLVDVTYTGTLDGPEPARASNLNLSKSNQ